MAEEDWTPYQKMEAGILKDISCDTDEILRQLEAKNMGEGFDSGVLLGMLANKGIDPGIVAMLNDRCRNGDWNEGGGIWIVLLFLFLLGIGGGDGFFGRNGFAGDVGVAGVDRTVVNEANYSRLLDAIGTQGTRQEMAMQGLAQTLNCDVGSIKSALCSIDKQLAVNQGSIINSIQSCCCNLQGKIQECCCETNRNIERQGCQTRADIQDVRFLIQSTDSATRQLIQQCCCDLTNNMNAGFNAIQLREDQREIQQLRDQVQRQREDANTALILQAISNKDTIAYTGTITGSTVAGSGTLS